MNYSASSGPLSKIGWLSPALAVALLVMFYRTPQPKMVSNQMWRAELLACLFLFFAFVGYFLKDRMSIGRIFSIRSGGLNWVVTGIAGLVIWSGISAIWARSPFSAWHHTAVWTIYLLIFLFTADRLKRDDGIRFVTVTFFLIAAVIGILGLIDYLTVPDFKMLEGVLRQRYAKYAEMLLTALPVIWAIALYVRKRNAQLLAIICGTLGWIAVMLSLSKGAFIAGVIGFTVMFAGCLFFSFARFRPRILVTFAVWIVVTIAFQTVFSFLTATPATVDYISGKVDATRETSTARIFLWRVGKEMIASHMLLGVGADNFGVSFNEARAKFRLTNPDDPKDETVSDFLVERAHNELIQITAELGIVGLAIVLTAIGLFLLVFFRTLAANRFKLSPMLWASVGGLTAFACSSMVSSFSFRLAQNGIVFFLVLAVAAHEMNKTRRRKVNGPDLQKDAALIFVSVAAVLLALIATFSLKAAAEYYVLTADREPDKDAAIALYNKALRLDPDYQSAHLRSSGRSFGEKDYPAGAAELRKAIDGGLGVVFTYSSLADCYEKAGDTAAAEQTYAESISIYPHSVYLRVRYAMLLQRLGKPQESESQIAAAKNVDPRHAAGWLSIITKGSVATFLAAKSDPGIALPAELMPEVAVYEYLDKPPGSDDEK